MALRHLRFARIGARQPGSMWPSRLGFSQGSIARVVRSAPVLAGHHGAACGPPPTGGGGHSPVGAQNPRTRPLTW